MSSPSDSSNTQRTKPTLSLNLSPSPIDYILQPTNTTSSTSSSSPKPPPALKPPFTTNTTNTTNSNNNNTNTSTSGWSANYNSSPSTNINYREKDLPFRDDNVEQQQLNRSKTASLSPTSFTESPTNLQWRAGHRRRESSLSINSEYTLSALPSPNISAINIWASPMAGGGGIGPEQDWANYNRRKSVDTFANNETTDIYTKRTGFSSPLSGLSRPDSLGRRFSTEGTTSTSTSARLTLNRTPPHPHDEHQSFVAGTVTVTRTSSRDTSTTSDPQNVMLLPSVVMPSDMHDMHNDREPQATDFTPYARNNSSPPPEFPLMRRSSGSLPSPRPPPALLPMEGLNRRSSERRAPLSSERRQNEAAAVAAAAAAAVKVQAKHAPCLNHERPHELATPPSTRNAAFPSRIGPYSIIRCLGSGSFSKVYLASRAPTSPTPNNSNNNNNNNNNETCPVPPNSRSSLTDDTTTEKEVQFAIKAIPRASILEDSRLKASVDRETQLLEYANGHPGLVRFVDVFSITTDGTIRGSPRTTRRRTLLRDANNELKPPEDAWKDYSPDNSSPDSPPVPAPSEPLSENPPSDPSSSRIDGWECLVLEYVQGGELFDWILRRFTGIPKSKEKKIEDEADLNRSRAVESRDEADRKGEEENPTTTDRREAEDGGGGKKRIWDHERDVKEVFRQLLDVVQYLHSRNIVHRDLKLENVLITENSIPTTTRSDTGTTTTDETPPRIKLTDFGLARFIDPSSPFLTTRCGSEEYAAPEIISGQPYDARLTDAWALGVILYACLTGGLPFVTEAGERRRKYLGRIARAEFKWPNGNVRVWKPPHHVEQGDTTRGCCTAPPTPHDYRISNDAKLVVEGLLSSSARNRWTIEKALQSPWLRDCSG